MRGSGKVSNVTGGGHVLTWRGGPPWLTPVYCTSHRPRLAATANRHATATPLGPDCRCGTRLGPEGPHLWTRSSLKCSAMQIPAGSAIVGRCWDVGFRVGDVFTELRWERRERREGPLRYETVEQDIAASLRLRVVEISFYGRLCEQVDPGHTVGLRLEGDGLPLLLGIDYAADLGLGKVWWLWVKDRRVPTEHVGTPVPNGS